MPLRRSFALPSLSYAICGRSYSSTVSANDSPAVKPELSCVEHELALSNVLLLPPEHRFCQAIQASAAFLLVVHCSLPQATVEDVFFEQQRRLFYIKPIASFHPSDRSDQDHNQGIHHTQTPFSQICIICAACPMGLMYRGV